MRDTCTYSHVTVDENF